LVFDISRNIGVDFAADSGEKRLKLARLVATQKNEALGIVIFEAGALRDKRALAPYLGVRRKDRVILRRVNREQ